jgi:glutamyl-Q tRNA(Asp) synthetase
LYAAAASYLDARAHGGRWLLRMEDLDAPREVPGAADGILRTLEAFGFEWDGPVLYQSQRTEAYRDALDFLTRRGLTFACTCSRSQLEEQPRYPGTCRARNLPPHPDAATRLRASEARVGFTDAIQGELVQDIVSDVGDFILRRRDEIFAYVLAVVVDDAAGGVSHVIRGADLYEQTPRQIFLMRQLQFTPPRYAHVPLLTEPDGGKLAKSKRSVRIDAAAPLPQILSVFSLLGMPTSPASQFSSVAALWQWGIENWDLGGAPKRLNLQLMR